MEIPHPEPRRDGFFFDEAAFRLDLYRLLCCFFASADFKRLNRSFGDRAAVVALPDEFQENEISRLLVTLAATVRVIQDRDMALVPRLNASCGKLWADAKAPKSRSPLSLREACNKIIHASSFNFDVKPLPKAERMWPNPTYVLRPFVHLYGKLGKVRWKAELNVIQFVHINASLIRG